MYLNSWTGSGRLTRDADSFVSKANQTPTCKFRLAINDRRDKDTLFIDVICFGKTAETLGKFLLKGKLVGVQNARLKSEEFEHEGQKRTSYYFVANDIELGPLTDEDKD